MNKKRATALLYPIKRHIKCLFVNGKNLAIKHFIFYHLLYLSIHKKPAARHK